MFVRTSLENNIQDIRVPFTQVKGNTRVPNGEYTLNGAIENKSFEVRLTPDEMKVLVVDLLDALKQDEKAVRSDVAASYRKLLNR